MIKDNIIYFGYGTVAVGSDIFKNTMSFQDIKPPMEVGATIYKELGEKLEWGTIIEIDAEIFDNRIKKQLLELKDRENKQINIDKYILDFSNFNEKSIDVIIKHLESLYMARIRCLAC